MLHDFWLLDLIKNEFDLILVINISFLSYCLGDTFVERNCDWFVGSITIWWKRRFLNSRKVLKVVFSKISFSCWSKSISHQSSLFLSILYSLQTTFSLIHHFSRCFWYSPFALVFWSVLKSSEYFLSMLKQILSIVKIILVLIHFDVVILLCSFNTPYFIEVQCWDLHVFRRIQMRLFENRKLR